MVLVKEEVAKVRQKAVAAKDATLVAMNEAQDVGIQAGFKVLRQILL